ncbi:MAG: sigma factor-like helix-turn-helix DNA-binding protein [Oscillospiraceae bacterium]
MTDKQRDVIDLYYNEDLSLSEIAEHENITRQGVRDSIKRGEQTLFEMEEKFALAERSEKFYALIEEISRLAGEIRSECGNPGAVAKRADNIAKLAEQNKELF